MKKVLISAALLALAGQAGAATVSLTLTAHNQRSSSGSLSTLKWSGCTTYTAATACINPANTNISGMGITPSTAVWSWDEASATLYMTGNFNTVSTLGSSGSAVANTVIGDKVTNLIIDTVNDTTRALSYVCAEGTFLAGVGANGCQNISLGDDGLLQSSMVYNAHGNANCTWRTLGGDDASSGNVRTLASTARIPGACEAGDGAFNMWTVVSYTGSGGQLVLSNGIATDTAGTNYLTFSVGTETALVVPAVADANVVPVPAAVWLLGSALSGLAWVRRRARA